LLHVHIFRRSPEYHWRRRVPRALAIVLDRPFGSIDSSICFFLLGGTWDENRIRHRCL